MLLLLFQRDLKTRREVPRHVRASWSQVQDCLINTRNLDQRSVKMKYLLSFICIIATSAEKRTIATASSTQIGERLRFESSATYGTERTGTNTHWLFALSRPHHEGLIRDLCHVPAVTSILSTPLISQALPQATLWRNFRASGKTKEITLVVVPLSLPHKYPGIPHCSARSWSNGREVPRYFVVLLIVFLFFSPVLQDSS